MQEKNKTTRTQTAQRKAKTATFT